MLIRQALITMLEKEPGLKVLFGVANGKELLGQLESSRPDILILDLQMPVMGGAEAYELIRDKYPAIKVIILSMHYHEAYVSKYVKAGVTGFLPKNCDFDKLKNAIYSACGHDTQPEAATAYDSYNAESLSGFKKLSERQIAIIRLLYHEKNVEEISRLLFLSKRTVEWHKNQIFEKTETRSVVGLLKYAISNGIISMP